MLLFIIPKSGPVLLWGWDAFKFWFLAKSFFMKHPLMALYTPVTLTLFDFVAPCGVKRHYLSDLASGPFTCFPWNLSFLNCKPEQQYLLCRITLWDNNIQSFPSLSAFSTYDFCNSTAHSKPHFLKVPSLNSKTSFASCFSLFSSYLQSLIQCLSSSQKWQGS